MEKLPKGIIKRGEKYRVSVMVDGKRTTQTVNTLREAEKVAEDLRSGRVGALSSHEIWNLRQAVDAFTEARLRSHRTRSDQLRWISTHVLAYFGPALRINKIDSVELHKFVDHNRKHGYSASTMHVMNATIRSILNFAWERGHRSERAPTVKGDKIRNGRIRFMTREEEVKVLSFFRSAGMEKYAEVTEFLVDTGARKSEMLNLEWKDIDLKSGRITFWETKTNEPRTVRMTTRVKDMLRVRNVAPHTDSSLIFGDISETLLYKGWRSMREALGLIDDNQFVLHMLRHTCCTRLLANNVDIRTVQQWMGHSSLQMTQRYAHFIPQRLDDAVAALDGANEVAKQGAEVTPLRLVNN
jgi:integrase